MGIHLSVSKIAREYCTRGPKGIPFLRESGVRGERDFDEKERKDFGDSEKKLLAELSFCISQRPVISLFMEL